MRLPVSSTLEESREAKMFDNLLWSQVSLYDIYLEVCPSRWTGIDPVPDPCDQGNDDDDEDDEDPETFTRPATASLRKFR